MTGKITKYFEDKGYGFISNDNGESYFFHISKVKNQDEIERGRTVEFTFGENEKGLVATDVEIVG
jgi:cold shock CspA family protein